MIRTVFIQRKVLELYQRMDTITYPIQPEMLVPYLTQNCRILTYQKMAELNHCSKCLDRLREKLARRLSAEEKPEAYDGQIVLFTGTEFTATDKQSKTYRYRMIGAEVSHDGLIRMLNLDTNRLTYVEPEWFRQRKIKVLQKETGLEPDDGFYDEAGGYHEGGCGTGPDGVFCGECSDSNCAKCEVWHRRREAQK